MFVNLQPGPCGRVIRDSTQVAEGTLLLREQAAKSRAWVRIPPVPPYFKEIKRRIP